MNILSKVSKDDELIMIVQGEDGIYSVTIDDNGIRCTCPAYQYYKTCPHIREVEKSIDQILN